MRDTAAQRWDYQVFIGSGTRRMEPGVLGHVGDRRADRKRRAVDGAPAGPAPAACASASAAGLGMRRFLQGWPQMACEAGSPQGHEGSAVAPPQHPT